MVLNDVAPRDLPVLEDEASQEPSSEGGGSVAAMDQPNIRPYVLHIEISQFGATAGGIAPA